MLTALDAKYYEDCYIEGSVDFIFGPATALFNRCEIRNNREKGYITAPSTPGTAHTASYSWIAN